MVRHSYDVIVVGAGLSGLICAQRLSQSGLSVCIVEAHAHAGGRIRSVRDHSTGAWLGDLGPTWIWPDFQPGLRQWLDECGIGYYPQFCQGNAMVDSHSESQAVAQLVPDSSGYYRISGGTGAIIEHLREAVADTDQVYGCKVERINLPPIPSEPETSDQSSTNQMHCEISVAADNSVLVSKAVIVATPPRVAAGLLWQPVLNDELLSALQRTPTWMARQAKVVLLYDRAFWREQGLSGRVLSRIGPLTELHDHCGEGDGAVASLTGFIGLDHLSRRKAGDGLGDIILDQLIRVFGPEAPKPLQIIVRDWSGDSYITTDTDLEGHAEHPSLTPALLRHSHFDQRVWFASAETAEISPGLLAGAIDGARHISNQVIQHLQCKADEQQPE